MGLSKTSLNNGGRRKNVVLLKYEGYVRDYLKQLKGINDQKL
jgi:hypothetical protein